MLTIALTGNVASGKSTVAQIWSDAGVPVVRADDLAREVVALGTDGLAMVVEEFGVGILGVDGSLDRATLRDRVFRDAEDRLRLERILHPLIEASRREWLMGQERGGSPLAVAEIPLLYEVGLEKNFEAVVLVVAAPDERLRRLVEGRDLKEGEATRIMEAQIPTEEKLSRADYVLENDGTREDLAIRALALLDLLRARARKGGAR